MMRVTEILRACGLYEWPAAISPADREWYLSRGTAIHDAATLYDQGVLDWSSVDDRIVGFVRAYEKFRREVGGTVEAMEKEVRGSGYAGRLDRIFKGTSVHPTGLLLVDLKTNEASVVTRLQTMAYALAYKRPVKRAALGLLETGSYKLEPYFDKDMEINDRAGWQACLTLAGWKRRNGI